MCQCLTKVTFQQLQNYPFRLHFDKSAMQAPQQWSEAHKMRVWIQLSGQLCSKRQQTKVLRVPSAATTSPLLVYGTHTFSSTIPLAWEAPPKGLAFRAVPRWAFLYCLSCHFCSRRWLRSFLAVRRPRHFPEKWRAALNQSLGNCKTL